MAQDMAVPHVLPAEIGHLVGDLLPGRIGIAGGGIKIGEALRRTDRFGGRQRPDAVRNAEGNLRRVGPDRDDDVLQGVHLDVSFQPTSLGSGGLTVPSQPTRLISCTLTRWKWTGWVSTPLWVIFQIWVSPSLMFSVTGSM